MALRLGQRRYDETMPVSSVETTPAGGRRMRARASRVGVFEYTYADGSKVREYRPPEEVLSPASIASWDGAVFTDGHPSHGLVTPKTVREDARGRVHHPAAEGSYVAVSVDADDAEMIAKIDSGDVRDVSGGYTADFDPTPGITPEGEPYDGVQRNIRANHLAGLAPGAGRQGPTVALRLDSSSAIASCISFAPASPTRKDSKEPIMTIRIDGIEYEVGSPSHLSALARQNEIATKRADDAASLVSTEKARADAAEAKLVEQVAKTKAESERADAAAKLAEPKALAKRIADRVWLVGVARQHIGPQYLADAKDAAPGETMAAASDDEIIKAVIAKLEPGLDVGKMDHAMLMGALLALCAKASSVETVEAPLDAVEIGRASCRERVSSPV